MSDELVTWLKAQLDADEAVAAAVDPTHDAFNGSGIIVMHLHGGGTRSVTLNSEMARYLLRHDPARVLREVKAKRAIVDAYVVAHSDYRAAIDGGLPSEARARVCDALRSTLRAVTSVYADRPGFREEWRA